MGKKEAGEKVKITQKCFELKWVTEPTGEAVMWFRMKTGKRKSIEWKNEQN